MFSIEKCVTTNTSSFALLSITAASDLSTEQSFVDNFQSGHFDHNGATGWFNVVSKPSYNHTTNTTTALIIFEFRQNLESSDTDTINFKMFARAIDGMFGKPVDLGVKMAAYELAACELEYESSIELGFISAVEQQTLTPMLFEAMCHTNGLSARVTTLGNTLQGDWHATSIVR